MMAQNLQGVSAPIHGMHFGKSYTIVFEDYGDDAVVMVLTLLDGEGVEYRQDVPRGNAVQYQSTHTDDHIDAILHEQLAED